MKDAECKCFTGRITRVINCLNSFSNLINIEINDDSQIGNIILLVKNKLDSDYTVKEHRNQVRIELEERGYDINTINEWLEYIE